MSVLVVVAIVKAKPLLHNELEAILRGLLVPTLAEPGCLRYEMNVSDDGFTFVFTEQWASKDHWERHMQTPYLEHLKANMDRLVNGFELYPLVPVDPSAPVHRAS